MTTSVAVPQAAVEQLAEAIRGDVIHPESPGYDEGRAVWNGMFDRRPAVIAKCAGVADVIQAVDFARANALEVSVRGGGHSANGYGTCDDGLVIDLSPMKGIRVDPESHTVRAEAGPTWGELDSETQARGGARGGRSGPARRRRGARRGGRAPPPPGSTGAPPWAAAAAGSSASAAS